jgi:hypothetical protein
MASFIKIIKRVCLVCDRIERSTLCATCVSRTLILSDLIENFVLSRVRHWLMSWIMRAFGAADPGAVPMAAALDRMACQTGRVALTFRTDTPAAVGID